MQPHTYIDLAFVIITAVIAPLINLFVYWRVERMHDCLDEYHAQNLQRFKDLNRKVDNATIDPDSGS